jgi:RES domain-containing protein
MSGMLGSWNQLERWASQRVSNVRGEARLLSARADSLQEALRLSEGMAVYRILQDFRELDLRGVVNGIVGLLRQCLIVMITSTGGGALIGGLVGGIGGAGVGAVPGVAIGAAAGAQMGEWILVFMGLKALTEFVVKDMPEISRTYWDGIRQAWLAVTPPPLPQQPVRVDRLAVLHAAEKIARGHVAMFVLLLMGIVAYLAKGRGSMADLAETVRVSKAGPGFAEWMVRNEGKLKAEPRLQIIEKAKPTPNSIGMLDELRTSRTIRRTGNKIESNAVSGVVQGNVANTGGVDGAQPSGQLLAPEAFHITTSTKATQGVLDGIDPAFLNPNSRFGAAFYVAEQPDTALAELAHHGADPSMAIRFSMNNDAANVLDLTNPDIAAAWGYAGGPITPATQAIGSQASEQGYNVIRFYSQRAPGEVNYAILDDFNDILTPAAVSPAKP